MKKLMPVVIMCLIACNASNKDADLIRSTEAYMKEQMKDPSSFQVIETVIIDTTMKRKFLQDAYQKDTALVTLTRLENKLKLQQQGFKKGEEKFEHDYKKILKEMEDFREEMAAKHLKELQELKQDSILSIKVHLTYRAKNSYGALDKESKFVRYYPGSNSYKIVD